MAELLPTGTVTLLLADVEGSTQLWETQPEAMTAAIARLNRTASSSSPSTAAYGPSSRARATASSPHSLGPATRWPARWICSERDLAPIKLRIGVHTGEVQLRDEGNYAGTTINKTARLRDLAHGGQTVMSGATEEMVEDRLPDDVVADRSRPPPACATSPAPCGWRSCATPTCATTSRPYARRISVAAHHLPAQLTTFVGRARADRRDPQHPGGQPAGDPDRRRRRRQDPSGDRSRRPDGKSVSRRRLVCRPGADHPSRRGAAHGRSRARAARPTGPLDHRHAAAVRPRPSDAAGARQLRTPARGQRRTGQRHAGRLLEGDDPGDES